MLQSQLILSGTHSERQQKAFGIIGQFLGIDLDFQTFHPDLIILKPSNSLTIAQVRRLQKQLALKPHSAPIKAAFISEAEKLTIPAQNALLKTLEEPPSNTLIILSAAKKESLLPTIVSRCRIIQLSQRAQLEIEPDLIINQSQFLLTLLRSGIGERLKFAQKYARRDLALQLANHFLFLWRHLLLAKSGLEKTGFKKDQTLKKMEVLSLLQIKTAVQNTEKIRQMLEKNVNPQLAIDNLFLAYPKLP